MGIEGRKAVGSRAAALRMTSVLRRSGAAVGLLLSLFLLLSLITFAPAGHPRGNLFGNFGREVARPILAGLGFGSFPLTGLLLFWLAAALCGRRASRWWLASAGIFIVSLCTAAGMDLLLETASYRAGELRGPGGLLGAGLADRLNALGGSSGALLFCAGGLLAGLVAATDGLAILLAKDVVDLGTKTSLGLAGKLPGTLRAVEKGVRAVGPVFSAFRRGGGGALKEAPVPPPPPTTVTERRPEPEREDGPDLESGEERDSGEPELAAVPVPDEAVPDEEEPEQDAPDDDEEPAEAPRRIGPSPAEDQVAEKAGRAAAPRLPEARVRAARRRAGTYEFPPLDLLDPVKKRDPRAQEASILENAELLVETLREFKIEAEVVDHLRGPVVTLYELDLAAGVKVNRIHNLAEDLAVALKAPSIRVVAPLPGKNTIGVEVPNPVRDDVRLQSLVHSDIYGRNPGHLPLFLGTDVAGNPIIEDLTSMPHVLIAGATGAGKSVCINSILLSLLLTRTPEQVRLILIDPKQVELAFFAKVPHLMSPVVTNMKKALGVLEWLVDQMEQRYALFHTMEVRNISSYNDLGPKAIKERKIELGISEDDEAEGLGFPALLPYIVIVVDELADLMMVAGKDIENLITRLAQKSRAVGLHIVLATQRPSTDVITGLIKANMPCRVSFQVASKIDSRVILDQNGADKLLGRGDMLYLPPRTSHLVRAQGCFVSDGEVKRVAKFLSTRIEQEFEPSLENAQSGTMIQNEDKDPLFEEAVMVILAEQRGSASLLQRALGIGYTRGSRIMDQMHKEGLVGPYKGSKAREVLMTVEEYQSLHGTGE
jgi:S-DNA-T family DNA segregation ATPase FtsK/SpoIIIE